MNQIKTIFTAAANLVAKLMNKVIELTLPLINPIKAAKKAGTKPSFIDYVKAAVGAAIIFAAWIAFAMIISTAAGVLASILSIVFAAWLAELAAAILIVLFEIEVFTQMFEVEATVAA